MGTYRKLVLPFALSGLSVGWLVGLSSSAVVGGVLGALLAIVAGILSVKPTGDDEVDPGQVVSIAGALAAFTTGTATGATFGMVGRVWLLPLLLGMQAVERAPESASLEQSLATGVGLFNDSSEIAACTELLAAGPSGLTTAFEISTSSLARVLATHLDEDELAAAREAWCE